MRRILNAAPDMELVGAFDDQLDLLVAVKDANADVVVVPTVLEKSESLLSHLRAEYPHVVVLGLRQEADIGFIEQLAPTRRVVATLDAGKLSRELRRTVLSVRALFSKNATEGRH